MPWWGWLVIAILVVVGLPLKFKILKKMIAKREEKSEEEI
ncbi:hypothetical protein HNR33_001297 [Brassicibacter mesophilus]